MKLNLLTDFLKILKIKFHENPSSGICIVQCGQADITKLIVDFHSFVNAPKKLFYHSRKTCCLPYPAHSMPEMLVPMYQITLWDIIENCNVNIDIGKTAKDNKKLFIICYTMQLVSTQQWGHHQAKNKKLGTWNVHGSALQGPVRFTLVPISISNEKWTCL
jgi:hypothetical protein